MPDVGGNMPYQSGKIFLKVLAGAINLKFLKLAIICLTFFKAIFWK